MIEEIISKLHEHKIKPTPMRMLVLEQMTLHGEGVSLNEMEHILIDSDRVTIYRTLQSFVKHGIVHSVDMVNRGTVYALCAGECTPEGHTDYHSHFYCESCRKIDCTEDFPYTIVKTPSADKYMVNKIEVVIKGICPVCLAEKR